MNTIADEWELFEQRAIPDAASQIQRDEMKTAFYAGVTAMLHLQFKNSDVSEDAYIMMITSWQEECTAFAQQMIDEYYAER